MQPFIYIIRQHYFAYDGQCFLTGTDYPSVAGQIYDLYEDQSEALQVWQQLLLDALRHEPSDAIDLFTGDGDDTAIRVANIQTWLDDTYGRPNLLTPLQSVSTIQDEIIDTQDISPQLALFTEQEPLQPHELCFPVATQSVPQPDMPNYLDYDLFCTLSDESILDFATFTHLYPYQLSRYPLTQSFFVVWLKQSECYLKNAEDDSLLWGIHPDFLQQACPVHAYDNSLWYFEQLWQDHPDLIGNLAELLVDSTIWQTLTQQYPCIHYDSIQQRIRISSTMNLNAYFALNLCLCHPLFEIQAIDLQQLKQLSTL